MKKRERMTHPLSSVSDGSDACESRIQNPAMGPVLDFAARFAKILK